MNNKVINGIGIKNIPWQEKPNGYSDPIWRYSENPIITNKSKEGAGLICNSAVVPFEDGFAAVLRCDDKSMASNIYFGRSKDGINFEINDEAIPTKSCVGNGERQFVSAYDPRITYIDGKYYVTWCNSYHGPTIGVGYTTDFCNFTQLENAFLPYNRNGVLFPRKINGNYAMLSRPSDKGHTPFGDIFYSESPDMHFWGNHRWMLEPQGGWCWKKTGPGPTPIETEEGWLIIYHGVCMSCSGFIYSMSAVITDINEPWRVKYRAKDYAMRPEEVYEVAGHVPNVVFPCANIVDAETGRIAIYYGAADTCVGLAFTTVDELTEFIKKTDINNKK